MNDLGSLESLLSQNEQSQKRSSSNAGTGKPLEIALDKIIEDPDQPRKEFDEDFINELAKDLENGDKIRSPISVQPADKDGFHRINHGANRYRASVKAKGVNTIPAFIDDEHDNYDQVKENIKRSDLTPMDVGRFIKRRIDEHGDKKGQIAKELGKPNAYVTLHLALTDLPECVESLYHEIKQQRMAVNKAKKDGLKRDVTLSERTLYDLKKAYEIDSAATIKFCRVAIDTGDITTKKAAAFLQSLKKVDDEPASAPDASATGNIKNGSVAETKKPDQPTADIKTPVANTAVTDVNGSDTMVYVALGDQQGVIDLNQKPKKGYAWFIGDDKPKLVKCSELTLLSIDVK